MELSIFQLLPTQKQFSSSIIFSIRLPALFDTKHKMGEFVNSEPDLGTIKPSFTSSSEPENPRSRSLIEALSLELHIEGGYFRQTDANPTVIPSTYSSNALSDETVELSGGTREGYSANTRRLSTTIFYLLTTRQSKGNFHRNRSRVIHTLHRGRGRYILIH